MSVRVEISEVRDRLVEFGAAPYLLTTSPEGRPHATHVVVVFDGERLECDAGRKTARNASVNAGVCLLWPPCEPGGFSLLIDGDATVWERDPLERLAADGQLAAYRYKGFWQPMDTLRDKRELEQLWASGKAPWKCW